MRNQLVADVVAELLTYVLTPALGHGDTEELDVVAAQFGVDVTGIEIISRSNGTYGINLWYIEHGQFVAFIDTDGSCSVG